MIHKYLYRLIVKFFSIQLVVTVAVAHFCRMQLIVAQDGDGMDCTLSVVCWELGQWCVRMDNTVFWLPTCQILYYGDQPTWGYITPLALVLGSYGSARMVKVQTLCGIPLGIHTSLTHWYWRQILERHTPTMTLFLPPSSYMSLRSFQ